MQAFFIDDFPQNAAFTAVTQVDPPRPADQPVTTPPTATTDKITAAEKSDTVNDPNRAPESDRPDFPAELVPEPVVAPETSALPESVTAPAEEAQPPKPPDDLSDFQPAIKPNQEAAPIESDLLQESKSEARAKARAVADRTSSYLPVEKAIRDLRGKLATVAAKSPTEADSWNRFLDQIEKAFQNYDAAQTLDEQKAAIERLIKIWKVLETVSWAPLQPVYKKLCDWLRPRAALVAVQWEISRIIHDHREPSGIQDRATAWAVFLEQGVIPNIRQFEAAGAVQDRMAALEKIQLALESLERHNRQFPWRPALLWENALRELYRQPNAVITADTAGVAPYLDQNLVTNGPVVRKGQVSYVTAGPKSGYGLLPNDAGVTFYNRQWLQSFTPVRNFQEQLASDNRGRFLAGLYRFSLTTQNVSELTIIGTFSPQGLALNSDASNRVCINMTMTPQPGSALGRAALGLIGQGPQKLLDRVYEETLKNVQEQVPREAREERTERLQKSEAEQNAKLRPYLPGNNTLRIDPVEVTDLTMRSRPEWVLATGVVTWGGAWSQFGAECAPPDNGHPRQSGVSVEVHLPSLFHNAVEGAFQKTDLANARSIMIETKAAPATSTASPTATATAPKFSLQERLVRTWNPGDDVFFQAVARARQAKNPQVQAIRIQKPAVQPRLAVNALGKFVLWVDDFQVEAALSQVGGGKGLESLGQSILEDYDYLKLQLPRLEIRLGLQPLTRSQDGSWTLPLTIEEVAFPKGGTAAAVNSQTQKQRKLALNVLENSINGRIGQVINIPINDQAIEKYQLDGSSAADPGGWLQVRLVPRR